MTAIDNVHTVTRTELENRYVLETDRLRRPFPFRPVRLAGLIKFGGHAFHSEKFQRALIMETTFPMGCGRSVFLCPRPEFHLPFFTVEAIARGKKIIFLVDAQQACLAGGRRHTRFFDRLVTVRGTYPDLLQHPRAPQGKMQQLYSRAACYATIGQDQARRALDLVREYLHAYLNLVDGAVPLSGDDLDGARLDFEAYRDTMIRHDPAMKLATICFGARGGKQWALEIFYNGTAAAAGSP